MIVDTQIHLWSASSTPFPWDEGVVPHLPEPFDPSVMLPLMDAAGVDRAIIAPTHVTGFRNDYALDCAVNHPDRFAVTGRIKPLREDIDEVMAGWLNQPGMVGVRVGLTKSETESWSSSEACDPFFAACERYQVPLSMFTPSNIGIVEYVAERFPALPIIIDHLGLPIIDAGFEYPDFPRFLALARYDRITVKMSTLASRSLTGYPFVETHELVKRAYDAYGPRRLMWGTDHTQQRARNRSQYHQEVDLLRVAIDFLSDEERRWILGENACRVFNWPVGVRSTSLATR